MDTENILVRLAREGSVDDFKNALQGQKVALKNYGDTLVQVFQTAAENTEDGHLKTEALLELPEIQTQISQEKEFVTKGIQASFTKGGGANTQKLLASPQIQDRINYHRTVAFQWINDCLAKGDAASTEVLSQTPVCKDLMRSYRSRGGFDQSIGFAFAKGDATNTEKLLADTEVQYLMSGGHYTLLQGIQAGFAKGDAANTRKLLASTAIQENIGWGNEFVMQGIQDGFATGDAANTTALLTGMDAAIRNGAVKAQISTAIEGAKEKPELLELFKKSAAVRALQSAGGLLSDAADRLLGEQTAVLGDGQGSQRNSKTQNRQP